MQLACFSPIFPIDPSELCFKFVDIKFLPLLQHEWISAVDFFHNSDPHIALTVARQVEVVASCLGLAFLQQVGMLSYISFVFFETIFHRLVAASYVNSIPALQAGQTVYNIRFNLC